MVDVRVFVISKTEDDRVRSTRPTDVVEGGGHTRRVSTTLAGQIGVASRAGVRARIRWSVSRGVPEHLRGPDRTAALPQR
jgi:hypothetical protein